MGFRLNGLEGEELERRLFISLVVFFLFFFFVFFAISTFGSLVMDRWISYGWVLVFGLTRDTLVTIDGVGPCFFFFRPSYCSGFMGVVAFICRYHTTTEFGSFLVRWA